MKGKTVLGIVVLGSLLVVFPGISRAGGAMHKSRGAESPVDVERALETGKFWSTEYRETQTGNEEALETGTLPRQKDKIDEPEINFDTDPRWKASGGN